MRVEEEQDWADLLRLAGLNSLALAQLSLRLIEDPSLGTEETRDQLVEMIEQLECGLARFEEFII